MPVSLLYDVIIIGGGPSGLNAAVVLGRCRRNVIVIDSGHPRNRHSQGIHNFLTRDDILPGDFLRVARKELKKYGVPVKKAEIISVRKMTNGNFMVRDSRQVKYQSKKLVIATGLKDQLPGIKWIEKFYGRSVFHCPYCDGWEVKDKIVGVYSESQKGVELAIAMKTWSKTVIYLTGGKDYLRTRDKRLLDIYKIPVEKNKISRLEGTNGLLKNILLTGKPPLRCDALFFVSDYSQQSGLAEDLGCTLSKHKVVITRKSGRTDVPGLYVVGDASWDMHMVIIAAAEGAKAGVYINKQLQKEEKKKLLYVGKIDE